MSSRIDQTISRNFHVAKVISILAVIVGHYFGGILWVLVTIGLLVFSYSSGFFTFLKYNGDFSKKEFWMKKAERLGIRLVVINVFLMIVFMIQCKSGIWTWHTVINMVGFNGFLNWFRVPNQSPYGAGGWFLTLLLIFYIFYPGIEYLNRRKPISYFFILFFVSTAFSLNILIDFGYSLWLTACGFEVGVFFARNNISIPRRLSVFLAAGFFAVILYFHYSLGIKYFDFLFVLLIAIFVIHLFKNLQLPKFIIIATTYLSGCLLEIYLIHGYLFVRPNGHRIADFVISLFLILTSAKILQMIASLLAGKIKIFKAA